jgi:hypothetical protein
MLRLQQSKKRKLEKESSPKEKITFKTSNRLPVTGVAFISILVLWYTAQILKNCPGIFYKRFYR